ncbi:MAG: AGE family epimerase/isomerase [Clostridia bacterium]|nr:AGE family epimerase/isomerase [Clostridia bacterium]
MKVNYKDYLTKNVLPFWLSHAIDEEYGGIFTFLDRAGNIYSTEKSVWFQGRALWTLSKAYNLTEKNETYLKAAGKIYSFLPRCTDTDGRMFFKVTREGQNIQKRRYYFSETFAAIGCAEYYKATGDNEVWKSAERYFNIAKDCCEGNIRNQPKFAVPAKALSPAMIMLSTARVMAECAKERGPYVELTKKYTEDVIHGGYFNEELGVLLETVAPDGSFMDTSEGRTVNPGHSLETAWFLMAEGLLAKNDEALSLGRKILDLTMPLGLDKKYGGIISFCDCLGKPSSALEWDMKLWWPQTEAIIANRMAYEIFGEAGYLEASEQLIDYAFTHFGDKEFGEWYGYLHYDSTPSTTLKGNLFKGPFHLPRMLMLMNEIENGRMLQFFE